MTAKDAASPRITISEAGLNALLDRREDERDAALADNARLRAVLSEVLAVKRDMVADWSRRREEIAVAIDHEAIDDRQSADALLDLVDDILATLEQPK